VTGADPVLPRMPRCRDAVAGSHWRQPWRQRPQPTPGSRNHGRPNTPCSAGLNWLSATP